MRRDSPPFWFGSFRDSLVTPIATGSEPLSVVVPASVTATRSACETRFDLPRRALRRTDHRPSATVRRDRCCDDGTWPRAAWAPRLPSSTPTSFEPINLPNPRALYALSWDTETTYYERFGLADYEALEPEARRLASVAATLDVSVMQDAVSTRGLLVTGNYFEMLGCTAGRSDVC